MLKRRIFLWYSNGVITQENRIDLSVFWKFNNRQSRENVPLKVLKELATMASSVKENLQVWPASSLKIDPIVGVFQRIFFKNSFCLDYLWTAFLFITFWYKPHAQNTILKKHFLVVKKTLVNNIAILSWFIISQFLN